MRLYGGRLLNSRMDRKITNRQEMRDAVVMSVDSTNRYALVKIQGSDTSIKAWYPENWESTPNYLKPGNAIRINQPGGNKARIEIMGMGMALPTAVPGGSVTPTPVLAGDGVLSGCNLLASVPESMSIYVTAGTFQIDEVEYSLSGMLMDDATIEMDRPDLEIDSVGGVVTLDAASATLFRYDSIVVAVDGIVDVVKGTSAAVPAIPATPADHIRLGFVLIPPNCTAITAGLINKLYSTPRPTRIGVTYSENPVLYATSYIYMYLSIRDQYGNYCVNSSPGWQFSLNWIVGGVVRGDGTLEYGGVTSSTPPFEVVCTGSYAQVKFTKDTSSELIDITESQTGFTLPALIQILDSAGEPVYLWTAEP